MVLADSWTEQYNKNENESGMCKAGENVQRAFFVFFWGGFPAQYPTLLSLTLDLSCLGDQPREKNPREWLFVSVTRPTDNPQSGGGARVAGADEGGGRCTRWSLAPVVHHQHSQRECPTGPVPDQSVSRTLQTSHH